MLALRLSYFTSNVYVSSLFYVLSSGNDTAKRSIKNRKFVLSFNLRVSFFKKLLYITNDRSQ